MRSFAVFSTVGHVLPLVGGRPPRQHAHEQFVRDRVRVGDLRESVGEVARARRDHAADDRAVLQEQRLIERRGEAVLRLAGPAAEHRAERRRFAASRRASSCASVRLRAESQSRSASVCPVACSDGVGELLRRQRLEHRDEVAVRGHVVESRGNLARPLVGLAQRDLADQPLHVVLVRDELRRQQVEQFGVRRRVAAVVQVDRMDEAAAHHHRPEAVHGVAGERRVLRRGDRRGQLLAAAVGRHRPHVLRRRDLVLLPLLRLRLRDRLAAGHPRRRRVRASCSCRRRSRR